MPLSPKNNGTIFDAKIKPNSRRFEIKANDEIAILCEEPPVEGRVNRELVKNLHRLFKCEVEIVSGAKSRKKRIFVNRSVDEVRRVLLECGKSE
jgi:uncharacterized protein (TIGR00251 family)